uniref:Large ribosomal subunit protein uL23 n=1 Tax=Candidatus Kentrum sp. TUN TaxID=2126343 RepID=A0A451A5S6_9GAMM|nr:MAG: LSU ribosomal protein L23P [Candidatus Kentron sp. TUN]VFK57547.1 MAG: LSU ribosomal protein L23P [Candidatus Kentron sp. TUN]VFK61353.1 MAG: LSU ribosomal protein L23P [Candidatus Kentron sp. TUN]
MNQDRMMEVLRFPHLSEKSEWVADAHRQIAFHVATDASKLEIKKSVEEMFGVKVKAVCTLNVKGKRKPVRGSQGRRFGCRTGWKKAYVTLEPGNDIDFLNVVSAL